MTKGQPRHIIIIQDGGAQEIWKQKYVILKFVFLPYRQSSEKNLKLALLQILYPPISSDSFIGVEVPFKDVHANCFCASLLRTAARANSRATMPRHASSARTKY